MTAAKQIEGIREMKTYFRNGFIISRTAGPDAPWKGWREDGVRFRADTLRGAFEMARDMKRE